jgi:hypothetical protein
MINCNNWVWREIIKLFWLILKYLRLVFIKYNVVDLISIILYLTDFQRLKHIKINLRFFKLKWNLFMLN